MNIMQGVSKLKTKVSGWVSSYKAALAKDNDDPAVKRTASQFKYGAGT